MFYQNFKNVAVLLLILLISTNIIAQVQTPRYISMTPNTYGFYEGLPANYSPTTNKYPLLLFIHGVGELGWGNTSDLPRVLQNGPPKMLNEGSFPSSFTVNGNTYSFIVISPQFVGWPGVGDIDNIINYAIANYAVDINRIYLTGLSMGGGAIWDYAGYSFASASRLAGIVPICGAAGPSVGAANNMAAGNLPVWATHNSFDPVVSVTNTDGFVYYINSAPVLPTPLAKKTIYNAGGHDAWSTTYNPSYKENGLNVYEWMLQYSRNISVVPVTGLEFNATKDGTARMVKLQWKTAVEINNQGFNILRSGDGVQFSSIGYVASKSVNGQGASYTFTDAIPLKGNNYYKLEQTDVDNRKTYSNQKLVVINSKLPLSIYPNPVADVLHLKTSDNLQGAQLVVTNSRGQNIIQKNISGTGDIPVAVSSLPAGIYYLRLIENGTEQKLSFIKN